MAFPSADMLVGSQAVMVVAGEKSQRETLNRLSVEEYNEGTRVDDPIDIHLTYRGAGATLLIRAEDLRVGSPAPAKGVIVTLGDNTFSAGECTVELVSVEPVVLRPAPIASGPPRGQPIPAYTGSLHCSDLHDLRTDARVALQAIFQYRPEESR